MTKFLLQCSVYLLFFSGASAQFYKNVLPVGEFSESLGKIVLDFRNNFANIQGTPVPKEVGMDLYESTVKLPGSIDNYIARSHSIKDNAASFQAIMYRGENYDQAVRTYKNVFGLIKKTRVKWVDKALANFIGNMEKPAGLNFTVSYLKVEIQDERYKDFITEIELINTDFSTWEVHINIEKKKVDIEIGPDN